ncbi:hypothetical protein BGZ76_006300 [Entomortierella beljakovae]|nr:hypothetical protein BGZ76_006300 [Entomortierella beljakovae]
MRSDISESSLQLHSSSASLPSDSIPSHSTNICTISTVNSTDPSIDPEPSDNSTSSIEEQSTLATTSCSTIEVRDQLEDKLCSLLLDGPRIDILSKLPYEITTYILHFLDMASLTKVAIISKAWSHFAKDNEVWRRIYLGHQQWKIKHPSLKQDLPNNHLRTSDTSQNNKSECAALDWKQLCHDRKTLEIRWKSLPVKTKLLGHEDSVYCIQFDNTKIVTGSRDRTIKFWDFHSYKCTDTLEGHSQSVLCLQFNDSILVSGSSDNTIIVWDMETRQPISRLHGHRDGVLDVCFDDKYIISCSKDASIKVWDVHTRVLLKTMTGHRGPVNAVQLCNGQVVSASGDGLVKLWDISTGCCIRDFIGHERGLACVQFDGETVVSGSNDKTIRIWKATTGECTRVLRGHGSLVRTLHFDKNRIVSGSYDYTVKVWDMATGECTLDLNNGHVSWVFDVQFSCSRIIR